MPSSWRARGSRRQRWRSPRGSLADRSSTWTIPPPKERALAALFTGASVVLFDRAREDVVALCRRQQITVLHATVFHVEQILATWPPDATHQLPTLRVLLLAASTVSDGLRHRVIASLTPNLHVRYGTNETGHLTMARPDEIFDPPGTVGCPPDEIDIDIVDRERPARRNGRDRLIRARSPGSIDGYVDDEGSTQASFSSGWFMPGDLGRIAPNGSLVHCGRADHLMILNGINIYPAEIEGVMSRHPSVLDTAVIPLQSSVHQDVPVLAVVLRAGVRLTEPELLDFARQRLGSHAPRRIVVLPLIPRTERGKLDRVALRRELVRELRRQTPRPPGTVTASARARQPVRTAMLRIDRSAPIDLAAIDDWFVMALGLAVEPRPGPPAQSPVGSRRLRRRSRLAHPAARCAPCCRRPGSRSSTRAGCSGIEPDPQDAAAWIVTGRGGPHRSSAAPLPLDRHARSDRVRAVDVADPAHAAEHPGALRRHPETGFSMRSTTWSGPASPPCMSCAPPTPATSRSCISGAVSSSSAGVAGRG